MTMEYVPRKWTWVLIRRYALDYLGASRLPPGVRAELRPFLGRPAYTHGVAAVLKRHRKPWSGL